MNLLVETDDFIVCADQRLPCVLGRNGRRVFKTEGDGATPVGTFALGRVFYRADRFHQPPKTGLPLIPMRADMGWCDDPEHADYNHLIQRPHPARHEILWRDDGVYDLVVEVLYNSNPIKKGRGSAIFIHVAKPGYSPTEGCIALNLDDLLLLLSCCNEGDSITIDGLKG